MCPAPTGEPSPQPFFFLIKKKSRSKFYLVILIFGYTLGHVES